LITHHSSVAARRSSLASRQNKKPALQPGASLFSANKKSADACGIGGRLGFLVEQKYTQSRATKASAERSPAAVAPRRLLSHSRRRRVE
jgi:hypothetical protein